ncbi:hypothetical protein [Aliikangiella sp. G2MR2-5]|uniref:hypothetical protein n=1 Tax=Aliikangiella sp. G2MR2-5 TaxID=2788943 RepID=UPI0018AC5FB9|nr:hypothetical protein [Aliikangiella sp. G2MR2-5]
MNTNHQWTTFQKGRLKVQACACCGELKLPSNSLSVCDSANFQESPLVKAGYSISNQLPISERLASFAA